MEKIAKLWFNENCIYIETDVGKVYSRPLEVFPVLMEATEDECLDFTLGRYGDDIRWKSLDEDIHISSFIEDNTESNYVNDISEDFRDVSTTSDNEIQLFGEIYAKVRAFRFFSPTSAKEG